ncbi:Nramp family divalent metal transporter [Paracrocinitomix mangrovi]|uniref:Nramp family divalent metal transporter n=1 Tax=Paracrocinitomix mangrovi TaxID=2862509 RepID=UPI001C8E6016|nr:Nramp family divalent metal transporter [Paracrocinitomix mangrovi]UKN02857.1 Nramp family divalent metal transporter [Paracrocinitomix mangrovi]
MKNLLKTLGPGILFASTAIGVSHLVQSTQAGANFGFTMIFAIVLANLFKYPFFEFGSRYANATGKSIISGYADLGKWALLLYFIITLISMFLVTAAVGYVTSAFMQKLFGLDDILLTTGIVFIVCLTILISDNFKLLDGLIKIIAITLLLSTLIAFIMVLMKGPQGNEPLFSFDNVNREGFILFLIPLMGWMPTAVDLSAWNSLWTLERIKQTGYYPKLKETLFDFNLGYLLSAVLSICFLTLGTFVMFGTGKTFSDSPVGFSGDVINLYTSTFGEWAYWIIAISAFSIMFGTCIAVFDGYSRAMTAIIQLVVPNKTDDDQNLSNKKTYRILLIVISLGAFFLIYLFLPSKENPKAFKQMVNISTSISFILAPIIAVLNLILVGKKHVGIENTPPLWIKIIAWMGIIFLFVFSILYIFLDQII